MRETPIMAIDLTYIPDEPVDCPSQEEMGCVLMTGRIQWKSTHSMTTRQDARLGWWSHRTCISAGAERC